MFKEKSKEEDTERRDPKNFIIFSYFVFQE